MSKEVIITKAYDLLKTSVPMLNKLSRNYKFTFGERVHNLLSDLLEMTIAYWAQVF